MTSSNLRKKLMQMIRREQYHLNELADKAINSGLIQPSTLKDDKKMANIILCAIYEETAKKFEPASSEVKKDIQTLRTVAFEVH